VAARREVELLQDESRCRVADPAGASSMEGEVMQSAEPAKERKVCDTSDESQSVQLEVMRMDCQVPREIFGSVPGPIRIRRAELVWAFWAKAPVVLGADAGPYYERFAQAVGTTRRLRVTEGKRDFRDELRA